MRLIKLVTLVVLILLPILVYGEKSITAIALFDSRAMLSIDGNKAKIMREGQTFKGVTLISSNTSEAVIEVNGKRESLVLNSSTVVSNELGAFKLRERKIVELRENDLGFFESSGTVNGRNINFLVDTGASLVVLNSQQANQIGLEYKEGELGYASTASGTAPMYNIYLDTISIGGIELNNVHAGVIEGSFPEKPLLGMTFLSEVNMTRNGNLMTLEER